MVAGEESHLIVARKLGVAGHVKYALWRIERLRTRLLINASLVLISGSLKT